MTEFYIGQIFDDIYPPEAAIWCNSNNAKIEKNNDGKYEIFEIPEHEPTWGEVDQARVQYRREHIDDRTTARSRKMANHTWTEQDEQDYLALDAEVTAWIEENLPYPEES